MNTTSKPSLLSLALAAATGPGSVFTGGTTNLGPLSPKAALRSASSLGMIPFNTAAASSKKSAPSVPARDIGMHIS